MKKLSLLLAVMAAFASFNLHAEVMEIGSAADFAEKIAATPDGDYRLTADIVFVAGQTTISAFSGTLDGAGHSISGLSQQLFGTLTGTIKDLTVKDWTAVAQTIFPNTGNTYYGIIANEANDGAVIDGVTIKNCDFRSARTLSNQYVGGFIGRVTAATDAGVTIRNSVLDSCQIGSTGGAPNGGGFVGYTSYCVLNVTNCEVVGSSIVGGYAGGIVSRCDNPGSTNVITGCSVGGTVTGSTSAAGICAGGRTSVNNATPAVIDISRCRNNAAVSAKTTADAAAGGIYGNTYRNGWITITDCENFGAISGAGNVTSAEGYGVGGIVGAIIAGSSSTQTMLELHRCVNYGDITAVVSSAGGILGNSGAPSSSPTFSHCSNYGKITAGNYAGGLFGHCWIDYARFTISDMVNYGTVEATDDGSMAGGIFADYGEHSGYGTPTRICSFGSVTASACAGAIYGKNNHCDKNAGSVTFKNCWLAGSLSALTTGVINASAKQQAYALNFTLDADCRASVAGAQHVWYGQDGVVHDDEVAAIQDGALTDGTAAAALGSDWEQGDFYPHMVFENDCGPAKVYYTVQFKDWDDSPIGEVQSVIRGGAAVAPDDPVRTGHAFTGWDQDFSSVKGDMVITATYAINHYTVEFQDYDGTPIGEAQDVTHGSDAVAPADPVREGYSFAGWSPAATAITSNTVCIAQYAINQFLVRFLDWDERVLKEGLVDWNTAAEAPDDPVREGYTFTGWDKEFGCITEPMDVTATYEQGVVTIYTVVFQDWDGRELSSQIVVEGSAADAPEHPEREGYDAAGWDKAFDNVVSDMTVTAVYTIKRFEVTFYDWDDSVYAVVTTDWNTPAVPPAVPPTREWYTFREWVGDISCVTAPCSAKAAYDIIAERTAGNAEEFAFHVRNADPKLVITLTDDIVLEGWEPCEFAAKIVGDGHSIKGLSKPLFTGLFGTVENVALDGDLEGDGSKTTLDCHKIDFGIACSTNCGGRIANVEIRNFDIKVSNSTSYKSVGFFAGIIKDGAIIENCTVAESCKMIQRNCYVGSIAGTVGCSDEFKASAVERALLAAIVSCTNRAELNTWYTGSCNIGGILGNANAYDSTMKPTTVISNCVNYGAFTSDLDSPGGYVGGILGSRDANAPGSDNGRLEITDCANYGKIGPVAAGMTYGGCIGHTYRLANVHVLRFVNYGQVGDVLSPKGNAITGGSSGGFIGYAQDGYGGNPIVFTDSANYGDVYGFTRAAGFFDQFSPNTGHPETKCVAYNCANYGKITALDEENGLAGEVFALFGTSPAVSSVRIYGAFNCFFPTDVFIASNKCSFVHIDNCKTSQDDGYTCATARQALNLVAAENGYEQWVDGNVGGIDYPELKIFCANPPTVKGLMLLFR